MHTLVNTPYGKIEGLHREGVRCYFGVPFAKPPLGKLRFRRAQPIKPWTSIYQAKFYAKDPIQSNSYFGMEHYSEDCLYLNIWVPDTNEEKKPVMVWIPGGAFANGGSGAVTPEGPSLYDCHTIAKETGCVVVSVTYRLNVFGFLNLSLFSSRFEDHLGMSDLVMALHWVQGAIESFDGDKDNVTLFGESAGATAISVLMMIDEAQPLFHKVIMQSNCFESIYTPDESREICELFLNYTGLKPDNAEGLLSCTYEQLMDAEKQLDQHVLTHYTGRCTFCPVADKAYIRDFPTLANYCGNEKPILIGSNRNEGNFQLAYLWDDPEKYAPKLLRRLSAEGTNRLLGTYCDFPDKKAFGAILTDVMYAFPKIRFAERVGKGQADIFLYRYDYVTTAMAQIGLEASHVAELLPLFEFPGGFFRQLYIGSEEEVQAIGIRMRAYWGAFARVGRPDVPGQTHWAPYSKMERNTLLINSRDELFTDPEADIRQKYAGYDRILI